MVPNTAYQTFDENSAHFVFTAQDGQNYALITDLKNGTVSFTVSITHVTLKETKVKLTNVYLTPISLKATH